MKTNTDTKFKEMKLTADGSQRASVDLVELKTLWFNSGTLCNLECANCYIESSPLNDRLSYITSEEVLGFIKEVIEQKHPVETMGITGGEPFLNPQIISILKEILSHGFEALVLTNATRVIKRHEPNLIELNKAYPGKLKIRVSLDHYTKEAHEDERGKGTFDKALEQLKRLHDLGFDTSIAGRSLEQESHEDAIKGYNELLSSKLIQLDLGQKLVVFPEMKTKKDVPEITTKCWDILSKSPDQQMCASERMIVKRKGDPGPVVMPCTLLAYDEQFILGDKLMDAEKKVYLNHRFCAEFCVLGGASCSSAK